MAQCSLGHLDFGHLILPFDVAQGGELVEPFRISDFDIRDFMFYKGCPQHPYGVMPERNVLYPWALLGFFRQTLVDPGHDFLKFGLDLSQGFTSVANLVLFFQ